MKIAMVYNPKAHKLLPDTYSLAIRTMALALIREFKPQHIIEGCSADDIEADVIIFFDPHSSHHIQIDGIARHPAIKYEFMDDPHQVTMFGVHTTTGVKFMKLGVGARIHRALKRGVRYIISPHKQTFYRFFAPYLGSDTEKMLVWFPFTPPSPDPVALVLPPLRDRYHEVLANGATKCADWLHAYDFRKWAFSHPEVTFVPHHIQNPDTPKGLHYYDLLIKYAGALALCDIQVCPKHLEMPLAGCLTFMQELEDLKEMGFKDYENCIFVNRKNFERKVVSFKAHPGAYQYIADAGRELVKSKYTPEHFAEFIRKHIEENKNDL